MPALFHTRGTAGACNFSTGKSWMDSTSPALTNEFKCVGDVFSGATQCTGSNDDEQPASTIAAALGQTANAGFLRDDALLVAVAITDEDEQPTAADKSAKAVYDRLVATKGDVKRMVFLGIGGGSSCSGVYGDAKNAAKLKEVTGLFTAQGRGVFWDLCNGKLEDGLSAAMKVIETACNELPPIVTK